MYYIIYLSAATNPPYEDELVAILAASRRNNKPLGITGVLLYGDGRFIQLLEGEKDDVQETFEKISYDPRHKSVTIIASGDITERNFPEWSMGFKVLDTELLKQFSGYLNPANTEVFQDKEEKPSINFLRSFIRTSRIGVR